MALEKRRVSAMNRDEDSLANDVGSALVTTGVGSAIIWLWSALPFVPGGFVFWLITALVAGAVLWLR